MVLLVTLLRYQYTIDSNGLKLNNVTEVKNRYETFKPLLSICKGFLITCVY